MARDERTGVAFALACVGMMIAGAYWAGCTIKPDALPAKSSPIVAGASHPGIKVKAAGLRPVLEQYLPQIKNALHGDYVAVVPGVEAQLGDVDVTVSQLPDGRVLIDLGPSGQKIRIDKRVLGFIRVSGTEVIDSAVMDEEGVDVNLRGSFISGVRLLPAD